MEIKIKARGYLLNVLLSAIKGFCSYPWFATHYPVMQSFKIQINIVFSTSFTHGVTPQSFLLTGKNW